MKFNKLLEVFRFGLVAGEYPYEDYVARVCNMR